MLVVSEAHVLFWGKLGGGGTEPNPCEALYHTHPYGLLGGDCKRGETQLMEVGNI